jgi:hypothetical protein
VAAILVRPARILLFEVTASRSGDLPSWSSSDMAFDRLLRSVASSSGLSMRVSPPESTVPGRCRQQSCLLVDPGAASPPPCDAVVKLQTRNHNQSGPSSTERISTQTEKLGLKDLLSVILSIFGPEVHGGDGGEPASRLGCLGVRPQDTRRPMQTHTSEPPSSGGSRPSRRGGKPTPQTSRRAQ